MKFVYLSENFYKQYSGCSEILIKERRPYTLVLVQLGNTTFAVPLRSHIKHPYALLSDEENHCALDYSKAVVITCESTQLDWNKEPRIRQSEFDNLRGKEYALQQGMLRYLRIYKRALKDCKNPRNAIIIEKSSLQYFHKELCIYVEFVSEAKKDTRY